MSGIILGPGLIGEAASKKAQETAVDDAGGGSIQLGPGLKDDKFKKRREVLRAAPVASAAALLPKIADDLPVIAELDLAAPEPVAVPVAAAAPTTGLSEEDVEIMLATDPNAWDVVAEAEAQRAEGWRPVVARMLLNAGAETTATKPMDEEIRAHLARIAEVGAVREAEQLRAAVDASPAIGTGDPEAPTEPSAPAAPKSGRASKK